MTTPSNQVQSTQPMPLVDRLLAMPSSLNDACRTMDEAHKRISELESEIATAMDILSEIPGDTLGERIRTFVAMSSALEAEWRKLNDRREGI